MCGDYVVEFSTNLSIFTKFIILIGARLPPPNPSMCLLCLCPSYALRARLAALDKGPAHVLRICVITDGNAAQSGNIQCGRSHLSNSACRMVRTNDYV